MCGITGIYSYNDSRRSWSQHGLEAMVDRLSYRGPDDKGMHVEPGLFLGHTRLSVLDLTSAGHQPMFTPDKRFVISYNGEIYNFMEIRKELESKGHRFVSNSDTEVLLAAWQEWGWACLGKIDGIFAFALFDRKDKKLFLVRDHFGVKPLFYTDYQGQVFFASELPALFGALNPCPEYNPQDLDVYFTFNYLPAPRSGLKGVYQLPPGCMLTVSDGQPKLSCYWKPEYGACAEPLSSKLTGRFNELLLSAVKRQLISDAPLGLFLSGGLDSYAVALSAVEAGKQPATFTLGFRDRKFSEIPAAEHYARHLKVSNESLVFAWTENAINETLGAMKELLADASCFPVYQLSKFTRAKVTVALAGDGGDELLAGYDTYMAGEITPCMRMLPGMIRRSMRALSRYLPSDNSRYGARMAAERLLDASEECGGRDHATFRRIFSPAMKKRLYDPDFFRDAEKLDPVGEYAELMKEVPSERSYLTARQHADLKFHLPSILAKVDRMSMANGLEVRVPLLNKQLVEFCLNLPDEAKRYRLRGKRILREAIADRAPKESFSRPKAGFLPPVDKWFREAGPMSNIFGDYLSGAKSSVPYLKWDEVNKLWDEHKHGAVNAGFMLLGILQFINWSLQYRRCK
ncbi:MAG: asparagine synthase (glutamine-hydrolyzing) [Candidatus Omnitrophota bacterium]|nr:asparagine synthase (glutamine-hydrolyzing) [Candidatus Omnitrophota bacterium]